MNTISFQRRHIGPNEKDQKQMLEAINISSFKPTNARVYRGYEKLLAGVWGY